MSGTQENRISYSSHKSIILPELNSSCPRNIFTRRRSFLLSGVVNSLDSSNKNNSYEYLHNAEISMDRRQSQRRKLKCQCCRLLEAMICYWKITKEIGNKTRYVIWLSFSPAFQIDVCSQWTHFLSLVLKSWKAVQILLW